MSLKTFHLIFITIAVLLCFGLGWWMLRAYADFGMKADQAYGVTSIVLGVALVVYEIIFIKKLKNVSYL
jgi:DNA-binding transcriptional regulator of glucitol operon